MPPRSRSTPWQWPRLVLGVVLLLTSCGGAGPSHGQSPVTQGFPRTAATFLSQDELPPVEELARYDVLVIDNEWSHREGPSFFDELRSRNPAILLLAYVNVVDYPRQLGSQDYYANRYSLWQFQDPTSSTFPEQWLARTAAGTRVSEWPDTSMTNLSDTAPRIGGETFADYAADWVVDEVWSAGVWDGIFLDVWGDRIYGADQRSWAVGGAADVPETQIYGEGGPWERGVTSAEERMRPRMPGAILVANGDRTLRDGLLDGRVWESFADPRADRDPLADLRSYVALTASDGHRAPGVAMTINVRRDPPGSPGDHRRARFFLTGTLMQNGFWAGMGEDYGRLAYYDEMDGAGIGRGYLGTPVVTDPTLEQLEGSYLDGIGQVVTDVYRRDFAAGIALHNAGGTAQTVDLGGRFQRLRGLQDPVTNDGGVVSSVTVPARDGLVLLRTGR